jgi:hypothetical protein
VTTPESDIFVDTSIQIARITHSPETKRRICARLEQHGEVVTSLVVKQEFKRRLLTVLSRKAESRKPNFIS